MERKTVTVHTGQVLNKSPEIYGLNGWWTDEDAGMWVQRYAELKPMFVRIPILAQIIEPKNDNRDPGRINQDGFAFAKPYPIPSENGGVRHLTYAKWLAALRNLDLGVIVYMPYLPGWLSSGDDLGVISTYPPNDLAEYRELVRALLDYLLNDIGFPPEKVIFEPINEPDLRCRPGSTASCFWTHANQQDLLAVMRAASEEAHTANPAIRIAGLSICCNVGMLEEFLSRTADQPILDLLTYHAYISSNQFDQLTEIGQKISSQNLPVLIDEYGSTVYWSNGQEGALWHSIALTRLWPSGIWPVEFVMSEMPQMHSGFNELGLFTDWTEGWQPKPSYWIYANFYSMFPGRELLALDVSGDVWALAGIKQPEGSIAIWLTHTDPQANLQVTLDGWDGDAKITILDNLTDGQVIEERLVTASDGNKLVFEWLVPTYCSITLLFERVK
jgi:hypothetical protein